MPQNRSTQRKLVGLLVKLGHKGLDEFASKYATNLSDGGMFIRTREPKPIGTELSFKIEIADGQRVMQGTAIVRWTRPDNDPGGPPGMGLEFVSLDAATRTLVDRMLGVSSAPAAAPTTVDEPLAPLAPPPPPAPAARRASPAPDRDPFAAFGSVAAPVLPTSVPPAPRKTGPVAVAPAVPPASRSIGPIVAPPPAVPSSARRTGITAPPSVPAAAKTTGPVAAPPAVPAATKTTGAIAAPTGPGAAKTQGPIAAPPTVPASARKTGPVAAPPSAPASARGTGPIAAPRPAAPSAQTPEAAAPAAPATARKTGPIVAPPPSGPRSPPGGVAPASPRSAQGTGPVSAPPPASGPPSPSTGVPASARQAPANDPFAVFDTEPVPVAVEAYATPPDSDASVLAEILPAEGDDVIAGAILEEEAPVVFGDVAPRNTENTIEVDYAALLEGLPAAEAAPEVEVALDVDVDLDLEVAEPLEDIEPLEAAPEPLIEVGPQDGVNPDSITANLPRTPLELPEAPPLRRDTAFAANTSGLPPTRAPEAKAATGPEKKTPVTLEQRTAPAPVGPPKLKPVYLQGIKPSDGTGPILGIDLGTTNSACAVLNKGRPVILTSKDGYNTIPSVVALTKDGKLQVGHRAKAQMVLNPTQSIIGAKRLVGREFDSPTVKQMKERAHFEIVPGGDRRAAVRLGNNALSLEEVQALVLQECREMAEQAIGVPVSRAVITCPAYYSEPQREAVRRAGAMAGLKVERVLNEPTAAALAFGMNRELSKTVLVYDLGGGTFDATLLRLEQNVFEVLATGGDVFLGGVDFDNQLVDLLLERFSQWHKKPFSGDRVALSRMAEAAENAKMALSERTTFDVHLPMLEMDASGKPLDLRTTVTRADLEAKTSELIDRTIQAVQDVLLDAKLKASQVDDIILVGGMSRMPLVREKLKALFKKPPHASVNADEAVALKTTLYSGTIDKVSSLVLIDVVPMTIGLGRPGGVFHRLIERNTALPAAKSFALSTQKDNQTELEVMVFQGEDQNVAANDFLGAVTITDLPKGPKGSVQVAVTLGLDAECVLRVEAREFKTRNVVRATLATRYTNDEIAQRLGITREKSDAVNKLREEELGMRAGGFWGKMKGMFARG